MTDRERIDHLEARLIGYGIALQLLLQDASAETKTAISRAADSAVERGMATQFTDLQIEQIRKVLLTLGAP